MLERARLLGALDAQLRALLPAELARQCRLASVRDQRLVFLASSGSWAARLRFHQALLLAGARKTSNSPITHFVVKIAPLHAVPREPANPHKPLTPTAARHLRAAAKSMADPELRAMYLRLASLADDTVS